MTLNSVRRIALSGRFCGVSAHHPQHLSAGGLRIAAAYSSATIPLSSSSSGGSFSPSSSSSKVRRDGSRLVTPGRLGPVRSFGITDTLANFAMKTVESSKGTTDLLASCCIVSYRIVSHGDLPTLLSCLILYVYVCCAGKQFEKMVEHMAASPTWTLRSWKQIMEQQLSSWLMYIPGMSSTASAQELTKMKCAGLHSCIHIHTYSTYFDFLKIQIHLLWGVSHFCVRRCLSLSISLCVSLCVSVSVYLSVCDGAI